MKVDGKEIRPIWLDKDLKTIKIIDQRVLPHEFVVVDLKTPDDIIRAIKDMYVRGAPLIGVTGAYGIYLALLKKISNEELLQEASRIKAARPTAINLAWAVDRIVSKILKLSNPLEKIIIARNEADRITEEEVEKCRMIGQYGLELIQTISIAKQGKPVNILTHCNAGWLACIEYGTATAPIYAAVDRGIDVHVWVDETRPLNQGARLTAWELGKYGIKHTVIPDNTGGHLMQHGMVDIVIVGTDRTTRAGDVANKIGTYLKALAAKDNNIPFYVALPSSTFDWHIRDGLSEIPIEERNPDEVRFVEGSEQGKIKKVLILPSSSPVANYAFDVTPARLITGLITEKGICKADEADILRLFPEMHGT